MYFGVTSIFPALPPQMYVSTERGDIRQPEGMGCFSALMSASSSSAKRTSPGRRRSPFFGVGIVDTGYVSDGSDEPDLSDCWEGAGRNGASASRYLSINFSSRVAAYASSCGKSAGGRN